MLYWNIGNLILGKQKEQEWTNNLVGNLSENLKIAFPEIQGFSEKNLKYMCKFAEGSKDKEFIQQVAAKITWQHNIILMDQIRDFVKRICYVNKIIENGWSKHTLLNKIELEFGIDESGLQEDQVENENNIDTDIDNKSIVNDVPDEKITEDNIIHSGNTQHNIKELKNNIPAHPSGWSIQLLKDPYILDFLTFLEEK